MTSAQAMAMAIREAAKGAGFVAPNPLVGCVILDRHRNFLATGYHHRIGDDHAEIDALKKITDTSRLEGGHVYVTLEPCAHQGRTGSCAKALAPFKLATLTYAVEDPNPLVSGQGAALLRAHGVDADLLLNRTDLAKDEALDLVEQAEDVAEIFLHNFRAHEPFVAMKVASSLDGKMAYASGESKWITGELAREHVHLLRARYDAVAIGHRTCLVDQPSLNVRHLDYPAFKNKVVVFDPQGLTLEGVARSNLARVRDLKDVIVVTDGSLSIKNPLGARVVGVPATSGVDGLAEFQMPALLRALKEEGLTSILLEGGAQTYASFFRAGKVKRVHVYVAPLLLGGRSALSWSSGFGGVSMSERIDLKRVERQMLGADEYWTARV